MTIKLYMTVGCQLCDTALQQVANLCRQNQLAIQVEQVDIVTDPKLYTKYATQIPVLENRRGEVLTYPFTLENLAQWLKSA